MTGRKRKSTAGILAWVVACGCVLTLLAGCRGDEVIMPAITEPVGDVRPDSSVRGFYLLDEGNMGSNKCSLDFYDYQSGVFTRNFYSEKNPHAVKELGDVGNDLKIYDGKLYAVINCSHKVEVMDAVTGIRIGQIDIPNCRYVTFHEGKGYVSSYVGPVQMNPDSPKGMVYEFDTATLQITRRVTVGYQPEELAVAGNRLYVANSGGYRAPDYDNTVSVIDLGSFRQIRQIQVAENLHRLRIDGRGRMWVTSRGNRADVPSRIYVLDMSEYDGLYHVVNSIDVACSNLAIAGDRLYYIAAEWRDASQSNAVAYGVIDTRSMQKVSDSFITDGTECDIMIPYGIDVHPESGDIFLTDARNYVSSGTLYCFTADGRKKWSVRTGDIPACIAFLSKNDLTED